MLPAEQEIASKHMITNKVEPVSGFAACSAIPGRRLTKDLERTDIWGEVHATFIDKVDSHP